MNTFTITFRNGLDELITEDINNKVVIVSNDNIYEEIEDGERIFTIGKSKGIP